MNIAEQWSHSERGERVVMEEEWDVRVRGEGRGRGGEEC